MTVDSALLARSCDRITLPGVQLSVDRTWAAELAERLGGSQLDLDAHLLVVGA